MVISRIIMNPLNSTVVWLLDSGLNLFCSADLGYYEPLQFNRCMVISRIIMNPLNMATVWLLEICILHVNIQNVVGFATERVLRNSILLLNLAVTVSAILLEVILDHGGRPLHRLYSEWYSVWLPVPL